MPKILINEIDNTSPGTPARYENYSVLIAGFEGQKYDKETGKKTNSAAGDVTPDSNGVYEFTSAADFAAEIGLSGPKYVIPAKTRTGEERTVMHYGNQMAYELLSMGYTVIYLPISNVNELYNRGNNIWNLFRDKASYDFRFVTHGLLESSEDADANAIGARLLHLENAKAKLAEVYETGHDEYVLHAEEEGAEEVNYLNQALQAERPVDQDGNVETNKAPTWYSVVKPTVTCLETNDSWKNLTIDHSSYANLKASIDTEIDILEAAEAAFDDIVTEANIITANQYIAELATYVADTAPSLDLPGRGDCVALIELDERCYRGQAKKPELYIIDGMEKMGSVIAGGKGKYCAMTVPSVYYNMAENPDFGNNNKFPGAFHYLACFSASLAKGFAEWYAVAGYNRGTCSYVIDHTTVTLGEIAINALEPRYQVSGLGTAPFACNVIANFRGSHYLWGNRTACELQSYEGGGDLIASHFLNIRQLCSTIKKQLYVACRRFTFDPNSDTLWFNFVNAVRPTLELMKADQGVRDFKIVKEFTDKKATLKAKVRIIPIEAVEDFDLTIYLEDSFGETNATVEE